MYAFINSNLSYNNLNYDIKRVNLTPKINYNNITIDRDNKACLFLAVEAVCNLIAFSRILLENIIQETMEIL